MQETSRLKRQHDISLAVGMAAIDSGQEVTILFLYTSKIHCGRNYYNTYLFR